MTPTAPSAGRALQFRVLGFPVRVDLSFVLVMALLGYSGPDSTLLRIALWLLVGTVGVLAHELGHALVARTTGASPEITLHGFGGVTRFAAPEPLSRTRSLAVTLAGPTVGVVVGLAVMLAVPSDSLTPGSTAQYLRDVAVFVNLGWGALNLLPVLPLDGGQALADLLPGDADARVRRAAMVSIPLAIAVGLFALNRGYVFGGLVAAWLAFDNVRLLRGPAGAADRALPAPRPMTATDRDLLWLLDEGHPDRARHLLSTVTDEADVDPAVVGLVLVAIGRVEQGRPLIGEAYRQAPGDPLRVGVLARMLLLDRDWASLEGLLAGPAGGHVPAEVVATARSRAEADGAHVTAARLAELEAGRADAEPADSSPTG